MRFLIFFIPLIAFAQPNYSINESEYRRRIDNVFYIDEILMDLNLTNVDTNLYKNNIVRNKDLQTLQQLESLDLLKRNEKLERKNRALEISRDMYKAKKYLRNLSVSTLNTEEKKLEFYNAVKTILENF